MKSALKQSAGAALEKRILNVLDVGPRPVQWFRSFAPSQAEFERAIGALVIRGVALIKGRTSGRVLAINGRRRA